MLLQNRVALVTGSSQGIGRGLALKLAEEGAAIIVNGNNQTLINETVTMIEDVGGQAVGIAADISKPEAGERLVEAAVSSFGKLDILINNAGITRDAMLNKMTVEQWDEVMAVHLRGMFLCTQAASAVMRTNKYGRVITISSAAGFFGNMGMVNYSTCKAGQYGFTIAAAKEMAVWARTEGCDITCNCVTPGFNVTQMTDAIPDDVQKRLLVKIPMGRAADPKEDIGPVVAFLASEEASYITGSLVGAGGGNQLGMPHMF